MAGPKKKYYAVRVGRTPGIYRTWGDCQRQTTGHKGAEFKGFPTLEDAEAWMAGATARPAGGGSGGGASSAGPVPTHGLAVDGGCSGNPGPFEYRGVDVATGEVIFSVPPDEIGTNNLAEFLALVEAMRIVMSGKHPGPIWNDSATARTWVSKGAANITQKKWKMSEVTRLEVEAAEAWLAETPVSKRPPAHAWDTRAWGQIPADYDRK